MGGAAQPGPHPGDQLHDAEGLADVVVRPQVQPPHRVHLGGLGGDQDDGDVLGAAAGLQFPEDVQPVPPGQHDVQQHQPGQLPGQGLEKVRPVFKRLGLKPAVVQGVALHLPDLHIVFHYKDLHGGTLQPSCDFHYNTPGAKPQA